MIIYRIQSKTINSLFLNQIFTQLKFYIPTILGGINTGVLRFFAGLKSIFYFRTNKVELIAEYVFLSFCIALTTILFSSKVTAQSFEQTSHSININAKEDNSAAFEIKVLLKNNTQNDIIGGYDYAFTGSKPKSVLAKINSSDVPTSIYPQNQFNDHIISVDFGTNLIKPGEEKELVILAESDNYIKLRDNMRFIEMRLSSDAINEVQLSFPASFNQPKFISNTNNILVEANSINFQNPRSTLLIWGDSYSINLLGESEVSHSENKTIPILVNLPTTNETQSVTYKNFAGADFGVTSQNKSSYAVANVQSSQSKLISFSSEITKNYNLASVTDALGSLGYSKENGIFVEAESNGVFESEDPYVILENMNQFLKTKFGIERNSLATFTDLHSQWNWIENTRSLSSFDACFVLSALGQSLGYKVQMEFGYVVIPDTKTEVFQPNFWCIFENENQSFIADPFTEEFSGGYYFGAQSDFDRISFGSWDHSKKYNNALGLLNSAIEPQSITLKSSINSTVSNVSYITNVDKIDVKPWSFFKVSFEIETDSSKVSTIQSIEIGDRKVNAPKWKEDLEYNILPFTKNIVEVQFPPAIIPSVGENNETVKLVLADHSATGISLSNSIILNYQLSFIIGLPILLILGLIVIFIIIRRRLKN